MQTATCDAAQTVKSFPVGSKAKSLLPTGKQNIWDEIDAEIYHFGYLTDYSYLAKRRCI